MKAITQKWVKSSFFICLPCALCFGCSTTAFRDRVIDVSNQPGWWGESYRGQILCVKQDMLFSGNGISIRADVYSGSRLINPVRTISVETFKADPAKWPMAQLVPAGTRLRCARLERVIAYATIGYRLYAEILDGDLRGKVVYVPSGMGNPRKKGSFRLTTFFVEPCE